MAETELSNEVVATTALPEITNLSVTEVSNGFELSWSVNDNNTTGNIAIERSTDNGNTFNRVISGIPRTTETFTDSTNFDADNPIYRIVRATDDAESVSSEIEYTEPTIPEEVPVEETLESTVTDDGIELTWRSDETDGEFIVYRDTNSGTTGTDYTQIDTVPAFTFNQYLDSGVSSGERYYYRTEYSLIDAVGGNEFDVTIDGVDYRIHEFTSDGTFSVNQISSDKTVDVLVVGGGGGGGSDRGGGGGAGGLIFNQDISVSSTSYSINVGSGGSGASVGTSGRGNNGSDSSALGLTAIGGGTGGGYAQDGTSGGSGGGGGTEFGNGGSGTSGQGFDGGDSDANSGKSGLASGGGGSSGPGEDGLSSDGAINNWGDGGPGTDMSQYFGTTFGVNGEFAGGGGGGTEGRDDISFNDGTNGGTYRALGKAGGGDGGPAIGSSGDAYQNGAAGNGENAVSNTGSGGGGGNFENRAGGDGGSGIVLIRYKL